MRRAGCFLLLAVFGLLAGCAEPGLYRWGKYEDLLHDAWVSPGTADLGTQAVELQGDIDRAAADGRAVPPGVHAHLGYVYYQQGNLGAAETEFEAEKRLFPESTVFIDGLLKRMRQQ